MKTFSEFQEQIKTGGTIKKPTVIMPDGKELPGLGGGGGGTDAITDKSPAKSFKNRIKDVGKILTFPISRRNIKPDPTEKFATEGVASLAVKGGSKLIPALMTGIGAAGTIMQAKKRIPKDKSKLADMAREKGLDLTNPADRRKANSLVRQNQMKNKKNNPDGVNLKTSQVIKPKKNEAKKTKKLIDKYKKTAKVIRPKEGEIEKQRKLLNKLEKRITKPKKGEKKEAKKTVKNFLKARKKEGETMYKLKQDAEIADKGPGDLLPAAKKTYLDKLLRNLRKEEVMAAPTNSTGPSVPGTGDDSSTVVVKKKKRYIYGGTGSRKMWMNNK